MPNKYACSDGSKVTEATIKRNLSEAYREHYAFEPLGSCEGCGDQAQGTAHILPKSQCKIAGKAEMIWNPFNWFRACHLCNTKAENINSAKKLLNYDRILQVTKELDYERYLKMTL
jgi:5-methylcytosine-specific restriction endonuclease McrA